MLNRLQTRTRPLDSRALRVASSHALGAASKFRLPFYFVEPAVFGADLIIVATLSLLTGLGYHWVFFDRIPDVGPYLAIGMLTFSNFSAILAARGDYRFRNLVNFRRQAQDVTLIWTGVFLILLGIAFLLKVEEELFARRHHRVLRSWLVRANRLAQCISPLSYQGARKRRLCRTQGHPHRRTGRLASSRDLVELRRYGYKPVRTFEITESEFKTVGMPQTLQKTLNTAIETARDEAVEEIILIIGWEHSRCIEGILNVLSVLPVPVHLLPDDNVARYLNRRMFHVGATWTAELKRAPLSRWEQALKRSIDVLCASIGLLMLAPLMLVTALLIKLDSNGPILFTQQRNGFNGRSFRVFKFRTMTVLEDGPFDPAGDPR